MRLKLFEELVIACQVSLNVRTYSCEVFYRFYQHFPRLLDTLSFHLFYVSLDLGKKKTMYPDQKYSIGLKS